MLVVLEKAHLKRLRIILQYRLIYVAIAYVIIILVQNHILYSILVPIYALYIWKNHRDLVLILSIFVSLYFVSQLIFHLKTVEATGQYEVKVLKVNEIEEYTSFEGIIDGHMVKCSLSAPTPIRPGEEYIIVGKLEPLMDNTIPNGFNYREYLYSKNIKFMIKGSKLEYQSTSFSFMRIGYDVENYIDNHIPLSKSYVKTFLLAEKDDIDQSVLESINMLGISHMFAVSGYHIGLLVLVVNFVLSRMNIDKKYIEMFLILLLVTYMIITSFSASVVRASLMYIFIVMNRKLQLNLSVLDILSSIFIVLLMIRPYYYFNVGFVLSFVVTYSLILSQSILQNVIKKNVIAVVSFIAFLVSFPIVILMNYQINLFTLIYNIIIIYVMSAIILPLSYIVFAIPLLDRVVYVLYKAFNSILVLLSEIDIALVKGSITNPLYIMILYIIIFYIFIKIEQRKRFIKLLFTLILVFFIAVNSKWIDPRKRIIFLDVYGDSIFISDEYNKCNILIDTGENEKYDDVPKFLKSINVEKIDYFFISHFHSDHYGEMNQIANEFTVHNMITKSNANMYSSQWTQCGSISFYIFELSYSSKNENNNSLIFSLVIENDHYLFAGDSEMVREMEFIDKYDVDVDFLKISHHGSITSSSDLFLDSVNPENAIIIVDRNNRNNHPHDDVIARLMEKGIQIYRTDDCGSIEITYLFGRVRKKYYSPN